VDFNEDRWVLPVAARGESMKTLTMAGVVLIVIGLAALAYQGVTYTKRETVLDIGPVHATADRQKTLPIPPIVGVVAVAGGVMLLLAGARKHA
jgi:uncharacterized membrane protein YidH (DUF202 family)